MLNKALFVNLPAPIQA